MLGLSASATDRCSTNPFRDYWDVGHYDLSISFDLAAGTIAGEVLIAARITKHPAAYLQIDIAPQLMVDSVFLQGENANSFAAIPFIRQGDRLLAPSVGLQPGNGFVLKVAYHGMPPKAHNAPWDGGMVAAMTEEGLPWWSVAVQFSGASTWWPCKDLLSDPPEQGISLHYTVPNTVMAIGNGRLTGKATLGDSSTYSYKVGSSINLYNVVFYIGPYVHFSRMDSGLSKDYYFLKSDTAKGKELMDEVDGILDALVYWLGPYPYEKDGYKLVQAPFLGMEHQSAIAYGNNFLRGYLGMDRSGSGVGLTFDFIALHESAHEWWGNNVAIANLCDMWINEGFATYSESLYIETVFGKEDARKYRRGKRSVIQNQRPAKGDCSHCESGSVDEYEKSAAMIHNLRLIMDDDQKFRSMLQHIQLHFSGMHIDEDSLLSFLQTNYFTCNLAVIFQQYLHHVALPQLEWRQSAAELQYRWKTDLDKFEMPLDIYVDGVRKRLIATRFWKSLEGNAAMEDIRLDQDYYYGNTARIYD